MEKLLQVALDIWICIFLDQQRTGGVAHEECHHPVANCQGSQPVGEVVQPRTPGLDHKDFRHPYRFFTLHKARALPAVTNRLLPKRTNNPEGLAPSGDRLKSSP